MKYPIISIFHFSYFEVSILPTTDAVCVCRMYYCDPIISNINLKTDLGYLIWFCTDSYDS